jgi:hypothetical protein
LSISAAPGQRVGARQSVIGADAAAQQFKKS